MSNDETRFYKKAVQLDENMLNDIKQKAMNQARSNKVRRVLLPITVCLLVAITVCFAVEPVRAAILSWFNGNHSVGDYVAQPKESRESNAELDAIIAKTNTGQKGTLEFRNMLPEWQEWADSLDPKMGDIFYDGEELIFTFDLGGGVEQFIIDSMLGDIAKVEGKERIGLSFSSSGYILIDGKKYEAYSWALPSESETDKIYSAYASGDAEPLTPLSQQDWEEIRSINSLMFSGVVDMSPTPEAAPNWQPTLSAEEAAESEANIKKAQSFDKEFDPDSFLPIVEGMKLSGEQQVELNMPIIATYYDKEIQGDGWISYEGEQLGILNVKFSFNAYDGAGQENAYNINKTFDMKGEAKIGYTDSESEPGYTTAMNKTLDLAGVQVEVKKLVQKPTGADLHFALTCPEDWNDLDRHSLKERTGFVGLNPRIYADGAEVPSGGRTAGLNENGDDQDYVYHIKMLPSEIANIKEFEIRWETSYYQGFDKAEFKDGDIMRIKNEDWTGYQTDGYELDDNRMKFSIK